MEIGAVLNSRYQIAERIGKGAMGTVYKAADRQTGETVAVKVLSGDLSLDPQMIERFRREGEALRQLRHPNIVGFVDMFEHEGQHVIVMEFVSGGSLHDLLKREGPLPIDRARQIALDLCDALTRAHRLEVIHRDIKPENILLAEDGAPRLTDFGVARLVGESTRLTGTGTTYSAATMQAAAVSRLQRNEKAIIMRCGHSQPVPMHRPRKNGRNRAVSRSQIARLL